MSMGIVSDNDFDSELDKLTPSPNGDKIAVIQNIEKGRGNGNNEVPEGLRKIIGEESAINGRASALELANNFDVSPSSVSAYNKGSHSTASYEDRPNIGFINSRKQYIAKKARNRLVLALNSLTQDKINDAKAKDIAGVAKDMSAVIRNMEPEVPKNNNGNNGGPTFIFYSPQIRSEKVFDVVHVKE